MADHDGELLGDSLPGNEMRSINWIAHPGELFRSPVVLDQPVRSSNYISRGGELVSGVVANNPPRGQYYISHNGEQLSLGSGGVPVPPQIGDRSFPTAYRPFNIGLDLP